MSSTIRRSSSIIRVCLLALWIPLLLLTGCQGGGKRVIARFGLPDPHPQRLILGVSSQYTLNDVIAKIAADGLGNFKELYDLTLLSPGLYVIEAEDLPSGAGIASVATAVNAYPDTRFAETDPLTVLADTPNSELYDHQWGLTAGQPKVDGLTLSAGGDVRIEAAWDITHGNDEIFVAVLDTGVFKSHPDLMGGVHDVINVIGEPGDPAVETTVAAHGTRTTGLLAAGGFPGKDEGIAGIVPRGAVIAIRVLNEDHGFLSDALEGLHRAVAAGIRVSSNSWLTRSYSEGLREAIRGAGAHGHVVVTVAGNDGALLRQEGASINSSIAFPAGLGDELENLIVVAAGAPGDRLASFSNHHPKAAHLTAPGAYILTPMPPSDWSYAHGTSYAVPYVAGAIALALAAEDADDDARRSSDIEPAFIKSTLLATVRKIPELNGVVSSGGMLDIGAFVAAF